jgi:glutamine cyclotransferase
MERHPDNVLNGITHDPADKTFLITGKNPRLEQGRT